MLNKRKSHQSPHATEEIEDSPYQDSHLAQLAPKKGQTPKKGRPTPSQKQATGKRPPIAPPPLTRAEAKARRKLSAPATKEERAANKLAEREASSFRRSRMLAGVEEYLLPKDRGPAKRFLRTAIDDRRSISNYFMPIMFIMLFLSITLSRNPIMQGYTTIAILFLMLALLADAALIAFLALRKLRKAQPNTPEGNVSLGFYAFARTIQLRRLRVPLPAELAKKAKNKSA